jgi:hypothetical protein
LRAGGFASTYQELARAFRSEGLTVANSRFAAALELSMSGTSFDAAMTHLAGEIAVERIEDDPIQSRVVPAVKSPSRLVSFLDGSQYTFPMYFMKHIPIYRTISAAAILQRDASGDAGIVPGSLRLFTAIIMPTKQLPPELERARDVIASHGHQIVDPLEGASGPEIYNRALLDYGELERASLSAAAAARKQLEIELLDWWSAHHAGDGWLVVDGKLNRSVPHAIGLVKSFDYQHLTGDEASQLFSLRAGSRTSAFVPQPRFGASKPHEERTLWYLRMRDAEGHDARYGLVRVELSGREDDSALIDRLSGWLLQERAPRATSDERSDTLLYPIHLLERMLKTHIASETRGWPGAR